MKDRIALAAVVAAATGWLVVGSTALAADKYQTSVVETSANPTNFHFTQSGKLQIKPSSKPGDGGIVAQLKLKGVDCPAPGPGNDGGAPGACGVSGSPVTNHVVDLSVNFAGAADLASVVGIKYSLEKGKSFFQSTGKSKINGSVFGALVSTVFGQSLGIGLVKLREAGSDPVDCDTVPMPAMSGCNDGGMYAIAGVIAGTDSGITCTASTQCSLAAVCTSGTCQLETCLADADCDQNGTGNGGTGECSASGTCCDAAIDPTCAAQVP